MHTPRIYVVIAVSWRKNALILLSATHRSSKTIPSTSPFLRGPGPGPKIGLAIFIVVPMIPTGEVPDVGNKTELAMSIYDRGRRLSSQFLLPEILAPDIVAGRSFSHLMSPVADI